jgi:TolA-binding protein
MRLPLIVAVLLASAAPAPLFAQADVTKLRVDKLEKEMKAVQRKVFPNGVAVQPEIGAAEPGISGGASNPVADIDARIDALEAQLKTLTGQVETDGNRLKKLEDAVKVLKADSDSRLKALEGTGIAPAATTAPAVAPKPAPIAAKPAPVATKPAPVATKPSAVPPVAPKTDASRKNLIAAVEIPVTADPVEDAYTYGYRLYSAKLFPEARVKLKEFVAKYPTHKRASYAQNLVGKAFFDEGLFNAAAVAFLENYNKNPRGERAQESLYLTAASLIKLKKMPDACKVFEEFDTVYGKKAGQDLKAKVTKGRTDAKCAA